MSLCPYYHLDDGWFARMLRSGGAVKDSITVWSSLDVAQPPGSVWKTLQVSIKGDWIIAGIPYESI